MALEDAAVSYIKLAKHCNMTLEECVEDITDIRGLNEELIEKIRELWDSVGLQREQGEQL